jgi:tRNA (guanine-N7-)-methyltransferase
VNCSREEQRLAFLWYAVDNRAHIGDESHVEHAVGLVKNEDFNIAKNEVSEIWITFPDPQIKYKRTKHRMTNADFLDSYKKVLNPDGVIHLKTDSEFMHGYTLGLLHGLKHEVIYAHHDVYSTEYAPKEVTSIKTFYEKQYLEIGKKITYIKFRLS